MKVVLSTSPHVRHVAVLQNDFRPSPSLMYGFAPVGLLSLAAALRKHKAAMTPSIYDLNRRIISGALPLDANLYEAIATELCDGCPDVIGFMTECDSYHHILQICEAIKEVRPDCQVVLGGPHASVVAHLTLETCGAVNAIVVGEGEISFPALLDSFESGSTEAIPGAIGVRRTVQSSTGGRVP